MDFMTTASSMRRREGDRLYREDGGGLKKRTRGRIKRASDFRLQASARKKQG